MYTPNNIKRYVQVKLMKKIMGFMRPTFAPNSKRQELADKLYDDIQAFERELGRCVTMSELAVHSGDIWKDLQHRELPQWLIDVLYSTLTYDQKKTKQCPTMTVEDTPSPQDEDIVEPVEDEKVLFKVGDWVIVTDEGISGSFNVRPNVPYELIGVSAYGFHDVISDNDAVQSFYDYDLKHCDRPKDSVKKGDVLRLNAVQYGMSYPYQMQEGDLVVVTEDVQGVCVFVKTEGDPEAKQFALYNDCEKALLEWDFAEPCY